MDPGDRIGSWVVEAPLGEGGMARVFRCHHLLDPSQKAAVKLVQPDLEPAEHQRMIQEFKLLRQLSHPQVLKLMEAGVHEEQVYLVTELLQGETLQQRLKRGPIPEEEAIPLFQALAQGVAAAHAAGIWHRDLKPANVFLSTHGPKLLDFGIAVREGGTRLTRAGFFIGTPTYMAPETFSGDIGAAADVYALGLLLWEALTGRKAFSMEKGDKALVKAKLQSEPFDPGEPFSPSVRQAVIAATQRDPEARPEAARWLSSVEVLPRTVFMPRSPPGEPSPADHSTVLMNPCPRCGAMIRPGSVCAVCETHTVPVRPSSQAETVSREWRPPEPPGPPGFGWMGGALVAGALLAGLGGLSLGAVAVAVGAWVWWSGT